MPSDTLSDDIYIIDKRFKTRVDKCQRVLDVAEAFGIGLDDTEFVIFDNLELKVKQGDVVYITGQSGSGKSLLLRELESQMRLRGKSVVNLDQTAIDFDAPIIRQIGKSTNDAINIMQLAGLNDAHIWYRKPGELSDGQKYRFRIAKAIESCAQVWVADEFLAVLDRVAAKVIAFSLQKVARRVGATVVVATTHTDMVEDLCPDLYIEKRYREKLRIEALRADALLSDDSLAQIYQESTGQELRPQDMALVRQFSHELIDDFRKRLLKVM